MTDSVLFVLTVAITLSVFIFLGYVHKRLERMTVYQEELRREMNFYSVVVAFAIVLWLIGWSWNDGPSGSFGIAVFVVFALISLTTVVKAVDLSGYSPKKH